MVPDGIDDISGLVFMGASGSVNDPHRWITQELKLIRLAERCGLPVLGICFGTQLLARALGGSVYPCAAMEIGWHVIDAVDTQTENPWLAGLPARFEAFQWHAHTFSVPPGTTPLWRSHCYQQQGFVKDCMLGMQFHLEVTTESIMEMSQRYARNHQTVC